MRLVAEQPSNVILSAGWTGSNTRPAAAGQSDQPEGLDRIKAGFAGLDWIKPA